MSIIPNHHILVHKHTRKHDFADPDFRGVAVSRTEPIGGRAVRILVFREGSIQTRGCIKPRHLAFTRAIITNFKATKTEMFKLLFTKKARPEGKPYTLYLAKKGDDHNFDQRRRMNIERRLEKGGYGQILPHFDGFDFTEKA